MTVWTVVHQASLSMEFSRQEYWSGLPFPSPGDLPDSGIEQYLIMSPASQVGSLPLAPPGKPIGFLLYYKNQSEEKDTLNSLVEECGWRYIGLQFG